MACAFWLQNVLCATTACNFSSLIWPDGSAPAAWASLLFDPLEPPNLGKTQRVRDFSTFSRTCIFFLQTLSLLWSSFFFSSLLFSSRLVSSLLFSSLILPTSAFSPVHIVGNLTSKLPSQNQYTSVSTNVIRCKPMETNIYIYIKISTCIYQCKSM